MTWREDDAERAEDERSERRNEADQARYDADHPPPMPEAPECPGDCDPEALTVDPVHGWVCRECGRVLGGMPTDPGDGTKLPSPGKTSWDPIGGALMVLDPSKVQGPQEFVEQILYMVERLGACEFAQRLATHERVEAEVACQRKYDRAVAERRGQGSADVRAAEARIVCEEELARLERAKAVLEAIKGAGHSWRSMISGYQSAARMVESTYNNAGYGR